MAILHEMPAFLAAVLFIAAVPGPVVALLIRRCSVGGFQAGAPIVIGVELGLYFWILAAGAGLAALVATSHIAYTALRVAGALVLTVLGIQAWRAALRRGPGDEPVEVRDLPAARLFGNGWRAGLVTGFVTNVANPKAAVFIFAFYPQFIPKGYPALPTAALLGLLQITIEGALYFGFAAAIGRARAWFTRTSVRRRLEALSGMALIALGLRVATQPR